MEAAALEGWSEDRDEPTRTSVPPNAQRSKRMVIARRQGISRNEFLSRLQSWTPPPKTFISPEANAMQLHQIFLDLYMPRVGSRAAIHSIFSAASSSNALSSAIKSVTLLLVHAENDDPRLFHAASPEYSRALRETGKELCRPDRSISAIVGMAHMLSLYELINKSTINEASVGTLHSHWLTTYVESCRIDNPDSQMRMILASNVRRYAIWGCLLARKGVRRFHPRLPGPHERSMENIVITLGDLAIATSGAAEASDKLCLQSEAPISRVLTVLNETIWLEGELHKCFSWYLKAASTPQRLYWTAPVNEEYIRRVGSAFRHFYEFVDLQTAVDHISYWWSLLVLTESRMSVLQTFFLQIADKIDRYSSDLTRLRRCSDGYADSLCMSMRFTSQPENGWAGRMMTLRTLSLLVSHFKQRRDWQKLSWCVQLAADFNFRTNTTSLL